MSDSPDPNLLQRQASDPSASVWVAASAGSGKTKVLTDRVLRLLLSGTLPSRILCITYTKAAAAEMQSRVFKRLGQWAVLPEASLEAELLQLTGAAPTTRMRQFARTLFVEALEESPGLRIQTIHSFCQSVLARFPLEAGVPPYFQVVDERTANELLSEAQLMLLTEEEGATPTEVTQSLDYLIGEASELSFGKLMRAMIQQRRRFVHTLNHPGGLKQAKAALFAAFDFTPATTRTELRTRHFSYEPEAIKDIRHLAQTLLSGSANEQKEAAKMLLFLESNMKDWSALDDYVSAFMTKEQQIRMNVPTKKFAAKYPGLIEVWNHEAERCQRYLSDVKLLDNALLSAHSLQVADALFGHYERLKRRRGVLDYDDLILHTRRLMCEGAPGSLDWVLYKLDGGIDHLLLDEAQDTSAEQWAITQRLAEEFYAGLSARDVERTLFVVGDGKQSIYRFQGAEPEDFHRMRSHFSQRAEQSRHVWQNVQLDVSFRSVQAVLDVVDATFNQAGAELRGRSGGEGMQHHAHRAGEPGRVELWPLRSAEDTSEDSVWALPSEDRLRGNQRHLLAMQIATTIRGWLDEGRCLEATGERITAGDILILLRSRAGLAPALTNALREMGVPVAGLDRLKLTKSLVVRDLIAFGETLLLPQGDLTLACVLKSPLYGLSEEALYQLCHKRGKAPLWQILMRYNGPDQVILSAKEELLKWQQHHARKGCPSPYEFYTEFLYAHDAMKRFVARMGEGAREVVDVFLEQARLYEQAHPPSLQGFLQWLTEEESDIKRDMEQGAGEVRIMTVHGAKGLEAPIVFLPDTTSLPRAGEVSFLPMPTSHEGADILVKLPSSQKNDSDMIRALRNEKQAADEAEYLRLLYVAMTRARDELYICGVTNERLNHRSWYHLVRQGMLSMEGKEGFQRITRPLGKEEDETEEVLAFMSGMQPAVKPSSTRQHTQFTEPFPAYFSQAPAAEAPRLLMLNPSRLMEEVESAFSPNESLGSSPLESSMSAQARGILMHRLLHLLSVHSPAQRMAFALDYLKRYHGVLSDESRETMARSLLLMMADPLYEAIFSPEALSEVSVSGLLKQAEAVTGNSEPLALSGQIDRLLITPERVLIVDFKTGEKPPFNAFKRYEIPELYRRQMEAYRQLLKAIYPTREVECALIYTAIPVLLPVPATLTFNHVVAI